MSQSDVQSFAFYGDDAESAKSVARVLQTGLFIGALVAIVAGGAILAWPGGSSTVIAIIFGLYFLIRGFVRVAVGIFGPGLTGGGRAVSIVIGIHLASIHPRGPQNDSPSASPATSTSPPPPAVRRPRAHHGLTRR